MHVINDRLRSELWRALQGRKYEQSDAGIYFPGPKLFVAGQYTTWINGQDMQVDPNIVPAEGLAEILKNGVTQPAYIAPFTTNATPNSALTAAEFDNILTEWVGYSETARQAWSIPADPDAGVYSNSVAPAVYHSTGAATVYGAGLLTEDAKAATTGKLYAASKFNNSRVMSNGDLLTIQYDIAATSA